MHVRGMNLLESKGKLFPLLAQRVGRGIALLFYYHSTRRGVSDQQHAPAVLYHRERPGIHCTGGCVDPRAGLDGWKISLTGI